MFFLVRKWKKCGQDFKANKSITRLESEKRQAGTSSQPILVRDSPEPGGNNLSRVVSESGGGNEQGIDPKCGTDFKRAWYFRHVRLREPGNKSIGTETWLRRAL